MWIINQNLTNDRGYNIAMHFYDFTYCTFGRSQTSYKVIL
jgi:hypothetical protein